MAKTKKNYQKKKPEYKNKIRDLEIEYLAGLEDFVQKELRPYGRISQIKKNSLRLMYSSDLNKLSNLKTIVAAYLVVHFEIPRPKAILGQENFTKLISEIRTVLELNNNFKSFRINAAGRDSSVFKRIAHEISNATKLKYDAEEGELLLRFRREGNIWQVLIRLSPKALSARNWRECNMQGGLNATVAYAINELANIKPHEVYLNAMCGSGTLLIENNKAKKLLGLDNSAEAIKCAKANLEKASVQAKLFQTDALKMPFENGSIDLITADLPWGDATGKHSENASLYKEFLKESARACTKQARLIILTHELRIFENLIRKQNIWKIKKELQVYHGGHYPKIYLLTKLRN